MTLNEEIFLAKQEKKLDQNVLALMESLEVSDGSTEGLLNLKYCQTAEVLKGQDYLKEYFDILKVNKKYELMVDLREEIDSARRDIESNDLQTVLEGYEVLATAYCLLEMHKGNEIGISPEILSEEVRSFFSEDDEILTEGKLWNKVRWKLALFSLRFLDDKTLNVFFTKYYEKNPQRQKEVLAMKRREKVKILRQIANDRIKPEMREKIANSEAAKKCEKAAVFSGIGAGISGLTTGFAVARAANATTQYIASKQEAAANQATAEAQAKHNQEMADKDAAYNQEKEEMTNKHNQEMADKDAAHEQEKEEMTNKHNQEKEDLSSKLALTKITNTFDVSDLSEDEINALPAEDREVISFVKAFAKNDLAGEDDNEYTSTYKYSIEGSNFYKDGKVADAAPYSISGSDMEKAHQFTSGTKITDYEGLKNFLMSIDGKEYETPYDGEHLTQISRTNIFGNDDNTSFFVIKDINDDPIAYYVRGGKNIAQEDIPASLKNVERINDYSDFMDEYRSQQWAGYIVPGKEYTEGNLKYTVTDTELPSNPGSTYKTLTYTGDGSNIKSIDNSYDRVMASKPSETILQTNNDRNAPISDNNNHYLNISHVSRLSTQYKTQIILDDDGNKVVQTRVGNVIRTNNILNDIEGDIWTNNQGGVFTPGVAGSTEYGAIWVSGDSKQIINIGKLGQDYTIPEEYRNCTLSPHLANKYTITDDYKIVETSTLKEAMSQETKDNVKTGIQLFLSALSALAMIIFPAICGAAGVAIASGVIAGTALVNTSFGVSRTVKLSHRANVLRRDEMMKELLNGKDELNSNNTRRTN